MNLFGKFARNSGCRLAAAGLGVMVLMGASYTPVFAADTSAAESAFDAGDASGSVDIAGEEIVGMPNPFQDFTTLAKAQDCAGYELKLPLVVPEGYSNPVFRAIPGEFLEVVWTNDEGDDFRYRKCLASDGDASGDYNDYAVNKTVKVGNVDLLIRADAASEGERVHVISGVASDGYSYAMTSTQGLDTDQLLALRQGFIDEWLPVALHGESVETAQYLMDTFATRLYDTGISLLYRDDLNPSYFFYITLHEENGSRFVDSVSYLENGQVLLDQDTFTVSAASQSQDSNTTASLLEQSMTGNFVNRISQRS